MILLYILKDKLTCDQKKNIHANKIKKQKKERKKEKAKDSKNVRESPLIK